MGGVRLPDDGGPDGEMKRVDSSGVVHSKAYSRHPSVSHSGSPTPPYGVSPKSEEFTQSCGKSASTSAGSGPSRITACLIALNDSESLQNCPDASIR